MVEKLLFCNFPFGPESFTVNVYGIIESSKKLFLKILQNDKEIKTYKLIAWQQGKLNRIYIHEKTNMFKQIGYLAIYGNSKLEFKLEGNKELGIFIQSLLFQIYKHMYKQNQWHYITPIEFSQKESQNKKIDTDNTHQYDYNYKLPESVQPLTERCPMCGGPKRIIINMGVVGSICSDCGQLF